MSNNLTELLKNHTSKQTNGPSTISASDFAQKPVSIYKTKWRFFFATSPKYEARNRTRIRISPRNENYLSFNFKETMFFLFIFFQFIIQRVTFEQHTKKGVFGTVRTEAYRRYIVPVLSVPDTSVSSVRHQYRYRTLREFGTTFIPVLDTWVSLVHQYRYRTLR